MLWKMYWWSIGSTNHKLQHGIRMFKHTRNCMTSPYIFPYQYWGEEQRQVFCCFFVCLFFWGGGGVQELRLLCGFNQYTLLQNRDNNELLGTSVYYSLKLGGGGGMPPPPRAKLISTYQIRDTKLHFKLARLLGFMLGNRGGLAPKIIIDST